MPNAPELAEERILASATNRSSEAAAPQHSRRSAEACGKRDGLSIGETTDEIDDSAAPALPRTLGVGHIPAEPLWVLLRNHPVADGRGIHQIQQSSRRSARVDSIRKPVVECKGEVLDGLLLAALEHREIRPVQDEVLVDELQYRHFMPCRCGHGHVTGAYGGQRVGVD